MKRASERENANVQKENEKGRGSVNVTGIVKEKGNENARGKENERERIAIAVLVKRANEIKKSLSILDHRPGHLYRKDSSVSCSIDILDFAVLTVCVCVTL